MPCWRPTSMVLEYHYYTGNEIEKVIEVMTKPLWSYHSNDATEPVPDAVIAHLSPARHEHINPYGTYTFNLDSLRNPARRALRAR